MDKNARLLPHLVLLMISLIYGSSYSIIKTVTPEYIEPFGFIVFRVLFAGAGIWLLALPKRETIDWKADGLRIVACAFTGVAFNQLIFFKGISMTSAIHGGLIMTTIPIFVFIFSKILLKENIRRLRIVGLTIAFFGTVMIIYQSGSDMSLGNRTGDLLLVVNSFSFSIYLVLVKPLMQRYSALTVTKWVFLIAFVIVLPFGFEEASQAKWQLMGHSEWFGIVFVILFATLVVYVLNNWALRRVQTSTVSIYIYTQPIFSTIVAVLFYGEQLTEVHLIASVLIFAGVYLVTGIRNQRPINT